MQSAGCGTATSRRGDFHGRGTAGGAFDADAHDRRSSDASHHAGDLPVNCRFGPGLVYEVMGGLRAQQTTVAEGRNGDGSWLHVHDPGNPGASCWVAVIAVNTTGDIQSLPVVGAPGASVERIGLRAEPQRITVGCGSFPQYFHITGEISANGPLIVTWQWELSDGERTPVETLVFQEAGTLQVARTESVGGPNDYRIYLHVFDPDEVVAQTAFYANCLP